MSATNICLSVSRNFPFFVIAHFFVHFVSCNSVNPENNGHNSKIEDTSLDPRNTEQIEEAFKWENAAVRVNGFCRDDLNADSQSSSSYYRSFTGKRVTEKKCPNGDTIFVTENFVDGYRAEMMSRLQGDEQQRTSFKDGFVHGEAQREKNGVVIEKAAFVHGIIDGEHVIWNNAGKLKQLVKYDEGESTDSWEYWRNGKPRQAWVSTEKNEHNVPIRSEFYAWHENGMMAIQGSNYQGLPSGVWKYWNDVGKRLRNKRISGCHLSRPERSRVRQRDVIYRFSPLKITCADDWADELQYLADCSKNTAIWFATNPNIRDSKDFEHRYYE